MTSSPPVPAALDPVDDDGADLVPGWLRRLAAIGWRVLAALALVAMAVGSTTDVIIMFVFNIVLGNFVAPLVYGRAVSLHPAIVLMSIPAGGAIAGILGMFLVVPFLGVLAATWRTILRLFDPDEPSAEGVTAGAPPPAPPTPATAFPMEAPAAG